MRSRTWAAVALALLLASLFYRDFIAFAAVESSPPPSNSSPVSADQRKFFEAKIRPVLQKSCFGCHSAQAKEIEGGLLLDSRAGLRRGGENGPVIVPGNVGASKLIEAIRYGNKDLQMPPDDNGGKLVDSVIHDFESWVRMGAPDPRDDGTGVTAKAYDTTEAKKWWSFQPLTKPAMPKLSDATWPRQDLDRFVLAALEAKNLKPVQDADKLTLVRRVYFDLIGLPPTPDEIDAFVNNPASNAFENTVDDLLARPQFGEHWGRHWLDVARYAESSGKDVNLAFPDAWRYRDYVIAAFNKDKPYNQFIREQLAGDQLPEHDLKKKVEDVIATGFLAVGPKNLDEMTPRQFDLDLADEQLDATSQGFLALTVSCARCHDHKFDPIMQRDYYAMAGIFLSSKTHYGTLPSVRNRQESDLIEVPATVNLPTVQGNLSAQERQKLEAKMADVSKQYDELMAERPAARRERKGQLAQTTAQQPAAPANGVQLLVQLRAFAGEKAHLENQLNLYDASGKPKAFCMGVQDRPIGQVTEMLPMQVGQLKPGQMKRQASGFEVIADSPLFFRGEMSDPRERVARGIPAFLIWSETTRSIPQNQSGRLELAEWIASAKNPLTARVMANRIWYWLFGQGIVPSVDNFGTMGESPSDQKLLDFLANRLIDNGWSIKKTIREIVLSRTYQLAGTYDEADYAADPQNTLLWRHSKRRLNAECIRDAMLASSGQLNLKPPLGSMVASAGEGSIGAGPAYDRINEEQFVGATGNNRSVYLPAVRDVVPDSLAVFDYADSSVVTGARETTNVPSQALYLLNSDFVRAQAKQLAARVAEAFPPPSAGSGRAAILGLRQDRVNLAFRLTFGRPATLAELGMANQFFARMSRDNEANPASAWVDFCLVLYNAAEFRYLN
jgi:hypothetical protein